MNVLLVGLGRWGANHLRILRSLPVTLYCADIDPAPLAALVRSGFPAARTTRDAFALLDRIDAAVLATPAPSHFELARHLLEAGKDVLVEKPLALTAAEAQTLTDLAARTGRILQVGHIFLYDPASLWLRDAVRRDDFGRLRLLRGNFSGFKRPRADGGVSFADAVHFAALFNFIVGQAPQKVTGHLADFLGRGLDDQSLIVLDYADGTRAQIETGYHVPGKTREITITGERLAALCDFNVAQYKIRTFELRHERQVDGAFAAVEGKVNQLEFPPAEPLLEELRAFLACVETRAAPLADGRIGTDAVRVIEAAIQSAREERTVHL